jgi:hypothetical protein
VGEAESLIPPIEPVQENITKVDLSISFVTEPPESFKPLPDTCKSSCFASKSTKLVYQSQMYLDEWVTTVVEIISGSKVDRVLNPKTYKKVLINKKESM